ncbi:MAG: SMC-Scp complex subunit ScpB [Planctomycetia bacterium]
MKPRLKSSSTRRLVLRLAGGCRGWQRLPERFAADRSAGRLRLWSPPTAKRTIATRRRPKKARETGGEGVQQDLQSGGHPRSEELARLEAALFLAREPLTVRRLAKLARLTDGTRARVLLKELKGLLTDSGSAFRVEQIAGGFQMLTRGPFGPWVRRLLESPPDNRLSIPAMETLAVVAYRQPITRAEIEAIRGVGCEEMLRHLLERDFVAIGGRIEEIGRPNVYVTTRRFLQAFGLARIEDLPPMAASEPSAPNAVEAG